MDAARRQSINAVTEKDGPAFDRNQGVVREAVAKNDSANFGKILADSRKLYLATPLDRWFADAAILMGMKLRATAADAQKYTPQQRRVLVQELGTTAKSIATGEFLSEVSGLIDRVKPAPPKTR